jgi:hypothetical protein
MLHFEAVPSGQFSRNQIVQILAKFFIISHIRENWKKVFSFQPNLTTGMIEIFGYVNTYNITWSHNFGTVHIPRILQQNKF